MKNLNKIKYYLLIIVFIGLFLNSCQKDPVKLDYKIYVSNEYKTQISAQTIKIKLLFAQLQFPEVSTLGTKVTNDIEVHKITYNTTLQNKNIQASGLIYQPKTAGNYPVLSFQNGTNTLNADSPSESPTSNNWFLLESIASMGFIVVVPDYIGFGASSQLPHPYLHAESTTQSILDMLRAVTELSTDDKILAKPTKDLFIFGYSQGGWATMQLQRAIEKNYSSEFNLIASSCAAGPYSIELMNEHITSQTDYEMPYFLTYLLNSYHSLKLFANPLSDFIQEPYASKIPGLYDGLHTGGTINTELTKNMANLLTLEYRTEFATNPKFLALKSQFMANSVAPWKMSTPTRLYHGSNDELIPPNMSERMFQDLKTAGTPDDLIEKKSITTIDHASGAIPVGVETIKWFLSLKK